MQTLRAIISVSRAIFPLFAATYGLVLMLHGGRHDDLAQGGIGIILLWLFINHKPEKLA